MYTAAKVPIGMRAHLLTLMTRKRPFRVSGLTVVPSLIRRPALNSTNNLAPAGRIDIAVFNSNNQQMHDAELHGINVSQGINGT